jgi:pyroglutamyl-peptidase
MASDAQRHILLTGFEPFDGDTVNPSGEVAKLLDGHVIGDCAVRSAVLPVQHEAARAIVVPKLEAAGLVGALHLGLAGGRARISLERVAVNVMDYSRPDAHGDVFRDVQCAEEGPAAYFSTLPLRDILAALTAEGIPAAISNTAGTYLCNYTLYVSLDAVTRRGLALGVGFVHLPSLPSMVAAHGLEQPSMDLATMVRATELALARIGAERLAR